MEKRQTAYQFFVEQRDLGARDPIVTLRAMGALDVYELGALRALIESHEKGCELLAQTKLTQEERYEAWGHWFCDLYQVLQSPRGLCKVASERMSVAFEELRPVPGYVSVDGGGELEHYWCVDEAGRVVDPTRAQFGGCELSYRAWKPGDEVRVGRCMNCGADIYAALQSLQEPDQGRSICGKECEREMDAQFNEARG